MENKTAIYCCLLVVLVACNSNPGKNKVEKIDYFVQKAFKDKEFIGNIRMSNVRLFMEVEDAKDKRATDPVRIENVKGLQLRDVSVAWNEKETEPKWESALTMKNVHDFTIDTFSGRQGLREKDVPAIVLDNCADGVLRNSSATNGTATFIHIKGAATKDITLTDNRTAKAKKPVSFENNNVKKAVKSDGY